MSFVYVFDFGDMVKVGYTTDLKTRKTSVQSVLKKKAIRVFSIPASIEVESLAHETLEPFRVRGEYYGCSFSDACSAVESAAETVKKRPLIAETNENEKIKFTMVMPKYLAKKLDYTRMQYGRSRIKEIEWACKEYIAKFESEIGEIEQEGDVS